MQFFVKAASRLLLGLKQQSTSGLVKLNTERIWYEFLGTGSIDPCCSKGSIFRQRNIHPDLMKAKPMNVEGRFGKGCRFSGDRSWSRVHRLHGSFPRVWEGRPRSLEATRLNSAHLQCFANFSSIQQSHSSSRAPLPNQNQPIVRTL